MVKTQKYIFLTADSLEFYPISRLTPDKQHTILYLAIQQKRTEQKLE
jgi:ATP-dependent phosphoenolpyruvate carboxykinase